ncbi:MAG: DegV family protein [Coprobacillus sp.]|nr:DegV family protein [Coprobacillus sp.]
MRYTFEIITDGSCDISDSNIREYGIKVVPYHVTFMSDPSHSFTQGRDISTEQYFTWLVDNPKDFPNTSCPSPAFFMKKFKDAYNSGLPIVCICISSTWSGSYNSALMAKDMMMEKCGPDIKIEVINSKADSILLGLIVLETARIRNKGYSFNEVVKILRSETIGRIYFTTHDLTYLEHGGRIGKVKSLLSRLIPINPIIVASNGELSSSGVALKKKRAVSLIFTKIKAFFDEMHYKFEDFRFVIANCFNDHELDSLANWFKDFFHFKPLKAHIGIVITSHVGPDTIGVSFLRKFDK